MASIAPVPLTLFLQSLKGKEFHRYTSNYYGNAHKTLQSPTVQAVTPRVDYFASMSRLAAAAKRELPLSDYEAGLTKFLDQFRQPTDSLSDALKSMQSVTVTARTTSPSKRNWTEEMDPTSQLHQLHKRRSDAFLQAREEAQKNLAYTYSPMDTDEDDDSNPTKSNTSNQDAAEDSS
jgi:hypothetical protein